MGGHLRHCLDFYNSFLGGFASGQVDYDARARDPRIETDRAYAIGIVESIMGRLHEVSQADEDRPLRVAGDRGPGEEGEKAWSRSTVRRELQFLRSHTVHHYALIGAVLKLVGFEVDRDFGVAPSTLTYRQATATPSTRSFIAR